MLNRSVEFALSNLIEAVKRSTGLELTNIELKVHRANEDQTVKALQMPGSVVQEDTFFIQNRKNSVQDVKVEISIFPTEEIRSKAKNHMSDIEITKYLEAIQPEEEEDPFVKCCICGEVFPEDEKDSRFDEATCQPCGNKQMEEWEQETNEQTQQYMNDRI
jgi:hypothetical protein